MPCLFNNQHFFQTFSFTSVTLPLTSAYNDTLDWFQLMEMIIREGLITFLLPLLLWWVWWVPLGFTRTSTIVLTPSFSHAHSFGPTYPVALIPLSEHHLFAGSAPTLRHHLSVCPYEISAVVSFQQHNNTVHLLLCLYMFSVFTRVLWWSILHLCCNIHVVRHTV